MKESSEIAGQCLCNKNKVWLKIQIKIYHQANIDRIKSLQDIMNHAVKTIFPFVTIDLSESFVVTYVLNFAQVEKCYF